MRTKSVKASNTGSNPVPRTFLSAKRELNNNLNGLKNNGFYATLNFTRTIARPSDKTVHIPSGMTKAQYYILMFCKRGEIDHLPMLSKLPKMDASQLKMK